MIKLFTKVFIASLSAVAVFFATACTESNSIWFTGTAEERNQSANAGVIEDGNNLQPSDSISSSSSLETENSMNHEPKTGSTDKGRPDSSTTIVVVGKQSSSSETASATDPTSSNSSGPIAGNVDNHFLSTYAEKTGIAGTSFANGVLGFNVTYNSSINTSSEDPSTAAFRTLGLHKATYEQVTANLSLIFPKTVKNQLENIKAAYDDGCSVYVLNVVDTSPAWHVLTNITKDSITIKDISDNCDYEALPFDMHVGFLFTSCDEITDATVPNVIHEFNGSNDCGDASYEEYFKN